MFVIGAVISNFFSQSYAVYVIIAYIYLMHSITIILGCAMKVKKYLYLDEDVVKAVNKIAVDDNTNLSAIVNKLLLEYLQKNNKNKPRASI